MSAAVKPTVLSSSTNITNKVTTSVNFDIFGVVASRDLVYAYSLNTVDAMYRPFYTRSFSGVFVIFNKTEGEKDPYQVAGQDAYQ